MRYTNRTVLYTKPRVSLFRILVHSVLVILTGGLWLIPLGVRYLLSK